MKASWQHGQRLRPNPELIQFLHTLKSGLEDMLDVEKAKLAELVAARDRIGGK